jgi:hypothetical protein
LLKSPRLHDVQAGWSKRIENLKQDADEAKRKFESKYRPIALALWRTTDGDLPFFNPIFFPKHNKGKSAFFDMATIVQQICMIEKGRSSGAPSDTRALRPDEQVTVEKMSRAKKGVAYISEEIGIEKRQMSDRRWKRSNPTLKKAVRRHLKRRSLS